MEHCVGKVYKVKCVQKVVSCLALETLLNRCKIFAERNLMYFHLEHFILKKSPYSYTYDLYLHLSEKVISYCGCIYSNVFLEHLIFFFQIMHWGLLYAVWVLISSMNAICMIHICIWIILRFIGYLQKLQTALLSFCDLFLRYFLFPPLLIGCQCLAHVNPCGVPF